MIIAFTGGRDYTDLDVITCVVNLIKKLDKNPIFRVGDCPTGLDSIIRELIPNAIVYEANWKGLGLPAGPERNYRMLTGGVKSLTKPMNPFVQIEQNADLLVAFPGGKGTRNCKEQAERLNIDIIKVSIIK